MPVIDEIRENQAKIKDKGFKYKFKYYVGYYWIPALVIIGIGIFVFSLIHTMVTAKDSGFTAIFINAAGTPDQEEFTERIGIDTDKYEVLFDSSYYIGTDTESYDETTYACIQKFMAVVASGTADVVLGESDVAAIYFNSEMYADLRDYFTDEELEALGDKVIWHTPIDTETGEVIGENYPLAIDVTDAPGLTSVPCFYSDKVYFCILANTSHPDYVMEFYDYIYEE